MKCAAGAAWSAILLAGVATGAYSATTQISQPADRKEQAGAISLEATFGKTLIAIDGSTIQFRATEGRVIREIVASNGAIQRANLVFINARLGTVTDSRDAGRVNGVFRASDQEILIQYGDGSSEIITPNASGGITIETITPRDPSYCTSWYPEGHVFSMEDRKAALAQFANRLGLGASTEKAAGPPARSGCESAAPSVTAASSTTSVPAASPAPAATPTPAALPPPPAPPAMETPAAEKAASSGKASAAGGRIASLSPAVPAPTGPATLPGVGEAAAAANAAELPPTQTVEVRDSNVHLIDEAKAGPAAAAAGTAVAAVATPADQARPSDIGASACLSVESDGTHWGFRNKCAFSVQYAYCTMDGRNQLTACKDGFVGGSVAPNGFGILVADQNLRSLNENHDFRWVACQGGAGEVIARLDRSDPPVGRCVR